MSSDDRPSGWYAHPNKPGQERYWDGSAWKIRTRPAQSDPDDPEVEDPAPQKREAHDPELQRLFKETTGPRKPRSDARSRPTITTGHLRSAFASFGRLGWIDAMNLNSLQNGEGFEKAASRIDRGERVVFGSLGNKKGKGYLIVVTEKRLHFITMKDVVSHTLVPGMSASVGPAFSLGTGPRLGVSFPNGASLDLPDIRPASRAAQIADYVKAWAPRQVATLVSDAAVAECRAKYTGGDFIGNTQRRGDAGTGPLSVGNEVVLRLTQGAELHVRSVGGLELARYPVDHPGILLDSSESVALALRKGPLGATAVATVLLGPIGLLGLAAGSKKAHREHFVLAVSDDQDYGAFALLDQSLGHRYKAMVSQKQAASEKAKSATPPEPELRPCRFCAEPIRPAAIVCRYCGRDLPFVDMG